MKFIITYETRHYIRLMFRDGPPKLEALDKLWDLGGVLLVSVAYDPYKGPECEIIGARLENFDREFLEKGEL